MITCKECENYDSIIKKCQNGEHITFEGGCKQCGMPYMSIVYLKLNKTTLKECPDFNQKDFGVDPTGS